MGASEVIPPTRPLDEHLVTWGGSEHWERMGVACYRSDMVESVPVGVRPVLVVDFGAQYAQLIARRIRECHVYSEIVPFDARPEDLAERRPAAIVLSGGPDSV